MVRLTDIDITNQVEIEAAMAALYGLSKQDNADSKFCLKDEIKEKEMHYLQQIEELNQTVEKLKQENKELQTKLSQSNSELSKFTIVPNTERQFIYLTVSDGKLEQTTFRTSAIYKAIVTDNPSVYEYEFNEEEAPHNRVISDWKALIKPYCEIENFNESGNYIQRVDKGEIKKNLNGSFDVTDKKAKVRFVTRR